ncbi:putative cytochrome P450 [Camillea tinctor]|nr:putative cytochrome P450 [Camillea tinctor]
MFNTTSTGLCTKMEFSRWQTLCYLILPILVISLAKIPAAITRCGSGKQDEHPSVYPRLWTLLVPRFILNLIFATNAAKLLEHGYQKFKNRTFQLVQIDKDVVVLPLSLLEELSAIPSVIASPHGALEHDLLGSYNGLDLVLETRLHHSIVQRKLTPRLGLITPGLERELRTAFQACFPKCDGDWVEFQPYYALGAISARLSAYAIVGPAFCRDPAWLDITFDYTENLFRTIVILRLFPSWMRPVVCRLLPSFWRNQHHIRAAKALLGPKIQELLDKNDNGSWSPQSTEDQTNVLSWLIDTVKGKDRTPDTIAHVQVLLALASVHTTLLRIVNVLYDLTANPELFNELRQEIETVTSDHKEFDIIPYEKLHKLDSVLRESQRMSPPTVTGLKRLFRQPYTFQNGLRIPENTYVCMPVFAIENDPVHTPNPDIFDGLRNYRIMMAQQDKKDDKSAEQFQFSSPGRTVLNFGYGKSACPGRFFASLTVKMLFAKLLTEYEFKFLPGTGRPSNVIVHEFLFPWPWQKMLVRRKSEAVILP